MLLWSKWISGTMDSGSEDSAKLKLDSRRVESWDCQEVDKYKTEGKVQLLRDTYT